MEKFEGQLLPACVDPSHLLTNMRVKVARDGILGVDKNALCIANRYPDVLNHTLVTDFLDKRNVAFAYWVFSQLVAEKNGRKWKDHSAGGFVSIVHNWYSCGGACETPVANEGISVQWHIALHQTRLISPYRIICLVSNKHKMIRSFVRRFKKTRLPAI